MSTQAPDRLPRRSGRLARQHSRRPDNADAIAFAGVRLRLNDIANREPGAVVGRFEKIESFLAPGATCSRGAVANLIGFARFHRVAPVW